MDNKPKPRPLTEARITDMRRFIRKYGSGNCWTGTVGEACTMIFELLQKKSYIKIR